MIDSPRWQLFRLLDGFVVTQLLYVASELGVAQALAAGPRTGEEIAEAVGADPAALTRVLRGLALEDVVEERDGRFALTPIGECMVPLAGALRVRGQVYYGAAQGLLDAVREGGTAFERVHGAPFFAYLDAHPEDEAAFQGSMAGRSEQEAGDVVAAYDFGAVPQSRRRRRWSRRPAGRDPRRRAGHRRHAGRPSGRRRGRAAAPGRARGVHRGRLLQRGSRRRRRLPALARPARLGRRGRDRILTVCRAAMHDSSRLLVVDAILPERARDAPHAIRMDLHMLLLLGARERTEAEFRALLAGAGLEVRRVVPTASPAGLSVIEAVPTRAA